MLINISWEFHCKQKNFGIINSMEEDMKNNDVHEYVSASAITDIYNQKCPGNRMERL